MFALIVQTILLFAVAFILGCIIGCVLRRLLTSSSNGNSISQSAATKPATTPTPVAVKADEEANPQAKPPVPEKDNEKPKETASSAHQKTGQKDNLKLIKGIGPQNEGRLNELGVTTFAQIAAWSAEDQENMGEALAFPGRIEREDWVGQASRLRDGAATEFSRRVEGGSVTTSVGEAESSEPTKRPSNLLEAPGKGGGDSLTAIKGVGAALEAKLNRLGIFHFEQIAALSAAELRWVDGELGFPGRAEREDWGGEASNILREGVPSDTAEAPGKAAKINLKS